MSDFESFAERSFCFIRKLIDEAAPGKRPEMARAILVAPTTGLRRAELYALRRWRDIDFERGLLRVSEYFGRMRKRIRLDHLDVHHLRKFMETHGQEMGYSVTQFAMRAGHDPRIAA